MDQNEPSKIIFEGEEFQRSTQSSQTPTSKIVQLIIKYSGGLVKDEKQAMYVLVGFLVIAVMIILRPLFSDNSSGKIEAPPGKKVVYPIDGPPRLELE